MYNYSHLLNLSYRFFGQMRDRKNYTSKREPRGIPLENMGSGNSEKKVRSFIWVGFRVDRFGQRQRPGRIAIQFQSLFDVLTIKILSKVNPLLENYILSMKSLMEIIVRFGKWGQCQLFDFVNEPEHGEITFVLLCSSECEVILRYNCAWRKPEVFYRFFFYFLGTYEVSPCVSIFPESAIFFLLLCHSNALKERKRG